MPRSFLLEADIWIGNVSDNNRQYCYQKTSFIDEESILGVTKMMQTRITVHARVAEMRINYHKTKEMETCFTRFWGLDIKHRIHRTLDYGQGVIHYPSPQKYSPNLRRQKINCRCGKKKIFFCNERLTSGRHLHPVHQKRADWVFQRWMWTIDNVERSMTAAYWIAEVCGRHKAITRWPCLRQLWHGVWWNRPCLT